MADVTRAATATEAYDKTNKITELGSKLKELREAQGLTLTQASEATKIQKKYISAIEEGNLDELPAGPYCRSFLRQYCAFLNAHDMWAKYDPLTKSGAVAFKNLKPCGEPDMSVAPGVFRRSPRFWIYLIIAASLAAAVWVTLRYRGEISITGTNPLDGGTAPIVREQREKLAEPQEGEANSVDLSWMDGQDQASEEEIPEAAEPAPAASAQPAATAQAQPKSATPTQPTAGASTQPAPAAPAKSAQQTHAKPASAAKEPLLAVTARSRSWLRVSRGSEVLYQGTMKPGEKKEFKVTGKLPIRLRCGNPSRTDASWNGAAPRPLGGGKNPVTRYYWSDGAATDTETR